MENEKVLNSSEEYTPNPKYILEVKNLNKYFPLNPNFFGKPQSILKAVNNVSFGVEKGKTIGIVGESGCGKTTLGRTILKLYESDGGNIWFEGQDITTLKRKEMNKLRVDMQLVFQDPYSSLPPRMTVGEIISEAVKVHKIVPKEEVQAHVLKIMEQCGLQTTYYDRYPHEFSGGQRQRVGIARAIVMQPDLIIADEPTSALDVSIRAQILNLLNKFKKEDNITYLFIAHDLSVVRYFSDRIGVITEGRIVEIAETEELFRNPLHPYTKSLLNSVPIPDPIIEKNKVVNPTNSTYHAEYTDQHKLREVAPGHLVMSTEEELEIFKKEIK